ncbi:hypothetical protein VP01_540g3 [Puccinia sorghi]|uniref:Uncharacterized protein n=1 Tax=Puccinia sorghi TaxID=27349 RepID=A0A0L6ULU2_9BASI|nr:hypothetical protein VP01_540g3 [Puccinia sorghi]
MGSGLMDSGRAVWRGAGTGRNTKACISKRETSKERRGRKAVEKATKAGASYLVIENLVHDANLSAQFDWAMKPDEQRLPRARTTCTSPG